MKIITAFIAATASLASGYGLAAAHLLSTKKTVVIDASAAKIWDVAKSFDGLNAWHPAVATDEIIKGKNDTAGAVRLLTLKGGGTIKEELLSFDAAKRKFRYKILEGVLPVSDYRSAFVVTSVGKHEAAVTWTGWFKRKDLSDHPAPKEDDKTAIDTIGAVYQAGLDNLKKIVEAE